MNIVAFAEGAAEAATEGAETAASAGFDWGALWDTIVHWMTSTGIKLVVAVLLLVVTFKIINVATKKLYKKLEKKHADETLSRVCTKLARILLKALVFVCLIGYVGIETASISAVIASIGVGISLAVQGTLANFAGGAIIIIMRPFKIGDFITSNGESGTVEDIKLFYTDIVTPDNKLIMIPNGSLANNVIVNATAKEDRRCDVVMSVAYETDIALAKNLIGKVCAENEKIFKTPAPFIEVGEYADSAINLYVRVWCKSADYWTVHFYLLDAIKKEFDKHAVTIPFNQLDVNLKEKEGALPAPEAEAAEIPLQAQGNGEKEDGAQEIAAE